MEAKEKEEERLEIGVWSLNKCRNEIGWRRPANDMEI